jgi:hypothetical protein
MAKADFKARLVWLPNAIRYNRPESPNVVRSWGAEFDLLPECALKTEALETLRSFVYGLGEGFVKALDEALSKASRKTMPNQEQEQEQEKESRCASPSAQPSRPERQLSILKAEAEFPANQKRKPINGSAHGSRLPDDWTLPIEWKDWARGETGWTDQAVNRVAEQFADYWHARPGASARKADWLATWRNWVRREEKPPSVGRSPTRHDPMEGAL